MNQFRALFYTILLIYEFSISDLLEMDQQRSGRNDGGERRRILSPIYESSKPSKNGRRRALRYNYQYFRKIIRIIRTLYFIFRIIASFQNQFISVVTEYQITMSAETVAGVRVIVFFFRLLQLRSIVLRILYLVSAILYFVRLLCLIICIYNH